MPLWRRRSVVWLIGAAAIFLLAAALVRLLPASYPTGDGASLSIYTLGTMRGRVLVGPYSQYGWNHPGPLLFIVMAPLYYASGYHEASFRVTALLINAGAAITMLLIARRFSSRLFVILTAVVVLLIEVRAGGDLAFSAWNPHVVLLPLGALLFCCAAVATGASTCLPLAVLLMTFIGQSNLGMVPASAALVCAATLMGIRVAGGRTFATALTLAALLALVLWALPVVEELRHTPGNLTLIRRFLATHASQAIGFSEGLHLFAPAYFSLFMPGMRLPVGEAAARSSSPLLLFATLCVCVLLAWSARRGARSGQAFTAAFCWLSLVATIAGAVTVARISVTPWDHHVFWLGIAGAFAIAAIADVWLPAVLTLKRGVLAAVQGLAVLALAVLLLVSVRRLAAWQTRAAADRDIAVIYARLTNYARSQGVSSIRLHWTQASWDDVVGIVLQSARRRDGLVRAPDLAFPITSDYVSRGDEDAELLVYDINEDPQMLKDDGLIELTRTHKLALAVVKVRHF